MRKAAQITGAALVAAVLVSGCSSSKNDGNKTVATPSATASQAAPSSAPSADAPAGKIDGSWAGQNADGVKTLTIVGDKAAIAGKKVCVGAVVTAGKTLLHLKCADHSTIDAVVTPGADGKSLSVNWGSATDTFARTAAKPIIPGIDKLKQ
ncbi:hypothetical protein [Streptantibioticus ferralitis]|uniref:Lipoprotein n=1 Tax=Streptantibioticus ferralitis TaxID=236510 RepID=A0ABT5Z7S0_9ACTN|nr:hypothetical protein [Streptantibioticus ferralitis]MDF2259863.1 hypothetical protein [Streptantibioticus ferralitis]